MGVTSIIEGDISDIKKYYNLKGKCPHDVSI